MHTILTIFKLLIWYQVQRYKTRSPEELIEYGRSVARQVTGQIRSNKVEVKEENAHEQPNDRKGKHC